MRATLTPFATHSSITPGTASAATVTIARSTSPGHLGQARVRLPVDLGRARVQRVQLAGVSEVNQVLDGSSPSFRSSVEAPTTATERGANTARIVSRRSGAM